MKKALPGYPFGEGFFRSAFRGVKQIPGITLCDANDLPAAEVPVQQSAESETHDRSSVALQKCRSFHDSRSAMHNILQIAAYHPADNKTYFQQVKIKRSSYACWHES